MSAELVYNVKFNIDPAEKKKITDIGTTAPVKLTIDDTEFEKQFQELRGDLKAKVFLEADATQLKTSIDAIEVSGKEVVVTPFLNYEALYTESAKIDDYFKAVSLSISPESISNVQVQLAPLFASRIIDVGFAVQEVNLEPISSKISSIKQSVESVRSLFSEVETASSDANVSIGFFADSINEVDVNVLKKINEVGLSLYTIGEGFGSFSTNLGIISSSLSEFSTNITEHRLLIKMLADTSTDLEEAIVGAAKGFNKFKEAVSNFRSLNNVNKKLQESINLLKEFSEITSVSVSADAVDDLTRNYEEVSKALGKATNELEVYKRKVDQLSQSASKQVSDNKQVEQSVKSVSQSKKDAARDAEDLSIKFQEVSREEMNALMESARMQERAARNRDKFAQSTEELTDKQERLRGVFFQEEQELKTLTAVTSNYDAEVRKMVTTGVKDISVLQEKIERLKETRKQLEDQIALVTNLARATELSSKEQEGANKALAQGQRTSRSSISTTKAYENSLHMLIDTQGDLTRQAGLGNKQFSAINQSIFSFGDLIQDASQFQFGFAQGMRAVGNNIAFTAELFAVSQANVERHNKAIADGTLKGAEQITMFEAFKNQLIGPTGVVLAVNVAVTAIAFLSQMFGDSSEKTNAAKDALENYVNTLAGIRTFGEDIFGLENLRQRQQILFEFLEQSEILEDQIKSLNSEILGLIRESLKFGENTNIPNFLGSIQQGLARIGSLVRIDFFTGQERTLQDIKDQLASAREELENITSANRRFLDENNELIFSTKTLKKAYEEVNEELAKTELLYAAVPILRLRNEISTVIKELQIFNEAGVDNVEQIEDLRDALIAQRAAWLDMPEETRDRAVAIEGLNNQIENLNSILKDNSDELDENGDKIVELDESIGRSIETRQREAEAMLSQIAIASEFGEVSERASSMLFNQSEVIVSLRQEIEDLEGENVVYKDSLEDLIDVIERLNSAQIDQFQESLIAQFAPEQTELESLEQLYNQSVEALRISAKAKGDDADATAQLEAMLKRLADSYDDARSAIVDANADQLQSIINVQSALLNTGKSYSAATELIQEHRLAIDNAVEGNEALEQTLSELNAQNFVENIFSQYTTVNDELAEFNRLVNDQREALLLLSEIFPNIVPQSVIDSFDEIVERQKKAAANQKIVNNLMAARELVDAGAVFAEIFGASKEFQIALATTSGLLAIVQTLADPSKPTLLMKLAASATIAATVAKQIQAIKNTEIGSAQDIEAPSAGSFGEGSSMTQVQAPTQNISFAPTAQNDGTVLNINNQVLATNKGLALITRAGEREIANSQKSVR